MIQELKPQENKHEIKPLDTLSMNDTVHKQDGYERVTLPEPTAKNMLLYMDKINELTEKVNMLTELAKGLMEKYGM